MALLQYRKDGRRVEVEKRDRLHYVVMRQQDGWFRIMFQLGGGEFHSLLGYPFKHEDHARSKALADGMEVLKTCPAKSFTIDSGVGRIL